MIHEFYMADHDSNLPCLMRGSGSAEGCSCILKWHHTDDHEFVPDHTIIFQTPRKTKSLLQLRRSLWSKITATHESGQVITNNTTNDDLDWTVDFMKQCGYTDIKIERWT